MKRLAILVAIAALAFSSAARATTYAHVTAAREILDPQLDASASIYLHRYNSNITANWHVEQVPDDIQHGARYSGSVTPGSSDFLDETKYTNPVATQVVAKVPSPLTEADFIQLVQTAGGMSDAQLVACRNDSNLAAMWIKFGAAPTINRDDPRVQQGLAGLEALHYINAGGAAAIIAAWPVQ